MLLPEDRTVDDTPEEHVGDHNELHRLHNLLDGIVPVDVAAPNVFTDAQEFQAGVLIDTDTAVPPVNGTEAMLVLKSSADPLISGILFKRQTADWGLDPAYGSGQVLELIGDSDADNTVSGQVVAVAITAVSNTTPVQITTAAAHGAQTGDVLRLTGTGIAALQGGAANRIRWWKVHRVDATHLTLDDSVASGAAATGYLYGDRSALITRLDGLGGFGTCGSIHLATGLRGVSGESYVPQGIAALLVQPSQDTAGVWLENPEASEWPATPVAAFIFALDARSAPTRVLWQVEADGVVRMRRQAGKADSAFVMRGRNDADSADVFGVRADGGLYAAGIAGFGTLPLSNVQVGIVPATDTTTGLAVLRQPTQSAPIATFANEFGIPFFIVSKGGYPINFKLSAIADADLFTASVTTWLDATPGATKFMIKAKDSGGTVRTGSVNLA